MTPNDTKFTWTKRREQAAMLVAADELTDEQIAASCGIKKRQLERWKKYPAFQARVAEHVAAWRERIKATGIADRERRIEAQQDRWQRLLKVISERAAYGQKWNEQHSDEPVPGYETGMLVRTERRLGRALVFEYAVDTGLLKEIRELEKHVATELGQWQEKHDVTSGEQPITFTIQIDRREDDDD